MHRIAYPILLPIVTFLGMYAMFKIGHWFGHKMHFNSKPGLGAAEGAVSGLLALLLGFTFSNAYGRYEKRYELEVREITDVSTAYARLDVFPEPLKSETQMIFRDYVNMRLGIYSNLQAPEKAHEFYKSSIVLQEQIWDNVVQFCNSDQGRAYSTVLFNAFNSMFDTATMRSAALFHHVPSLIFLMLIGTCFMSSLLVGYVVAGSTEKYSVQVILFALVTALTIYVIYDLEFPSEGIMRVSVNENVINDLKSAIGIK